MQATRQSDGIMIGGGRAQMIEISQHTRPTYCAGRPSLHMNHGTGDVVGPPASSDVVNHGLQIVLPEQCPEHDEALRRQECKRHPLPSRIEGGFCTTNRDKQCQRRTQRSPSRPLLMSVPKSFQCDRRGCLYSDHILQS